MVKDHVHFSHVSKTGDQIPSCGFPVGETCRPDAPCRLLCYGRRGRFAFAHNKDLLETNLEIWHENPAFFRQEVIITSFPAKFFRWFPIGDIPDPQFYAMMCDVCSDVPGTRYLAFTKKYEIVNDYLDHYEEPDNLTTVLSAWGDFVPENPHNLPVAYIRLKNQQCSIPKDAYECPLFCGNCVLTGHSCWDLKRGESVVFNQH